MSRFEDRAAQPGRVPGRVVVAGAPQGYDALLLARLARSATAPVLHVARDANRLAAMAEAMRFFAPDLAVIEFPAWDCLPYDRVSPNPEVVSRRMAALSQLAAGAGEQKGVVVLTTLNAAMQYVPPRAALARQSFRMRVGQPLDLDALSAFFARNGYSRTGMVVEPGEFAQRGGLIDIFPPGLPEPLRLDLFGDSLETIRSFDPDSQRTTGTREDLTLVPMSEVLLDKDSIHRFRTGYVARFGAVTGENPLYEAVTEGRRQAGMEHWLPLFYEKLETLFDYLPQAPIAFDPLVEEARQERLDAVRDFYAARRRADEGGAMAGRYNPLPPEALYLDEGAWAAALEGRILRLFTPHDAPEGERVEHAGGRPGRNFAPERGQEGVNLFDALCAHIRALHQAGRRVVLVSHSRGARERLAGVLADHGLDDLAPVESWSEALDLPRERVALAVLGLESGFETAEVALISEQDVLGERLLRQRRRPRRAENFLREVTGLSLGDLVVHVDHGIGRYEGLETLDVNGAAHDCLLIVYHGGDKLYLPVENIELLSRYGSEESEVQLDRLGSTAWQTRKARLKKRVLEMAGELIEIAAARHLRQVPPLHPPHGAYEEFCARFPFEETEDQQRAIEDVLEDLASGHPMDRLVCGDVGFGKTEVALRAAFVAAINGHQVAVIAPTTLLARQHFETFRERFAGFPVRLAQLSRLVPAKEASAARTGLAEGQVDIVIGTHAILGKTVRFRDLGLVIVDEEQHFGVRHKEKLKSLRADVHMLTLTATPIPRTLQLGLAGVREMSLIATPPVDRLAVRSFVLPFDPVVIREALLREHYRGGQSFYVCPRISDLAEAEALLHDFVPEVKTVTAHGQMSAADLDAAMSAFCERRYDVLLCTTIIESGLDIASANTLIVHRADMFGLAQLYQIRGRIGRSKLRAYSYLTLPPNRTLTPTAEKRLRVMQSLDTLGAGFTLASHDLDIRGAGNLLGEEQSGHIREVGIELYQSMLEEAVASLRAGEGAAASEEKWSPQIALGTAVLIPEDYVTDLDLRLGLYRRLAEIEAPSDIEAFAAELIDRFGPLPEEVKNLLHVVTIKRLCRQAGIEKLDAGPKGATIAFRNDSFANPEGLVAFIARHQARVRLRSDHRLVWKADWEAASARLQGAMALVADLVALAHPAAAAA